MLKYVPIVKALRRYWRMTQDPRTPPIVRGLIWFGIAATIAPKKVLPKNVPGLGLVDDAALVPSIIALTMVLIPKEVREKYDRMEKREIKENKVEGAVQAHEANLEGAEAAN